MPDEEKYASLKGKERGHVVKTGLTSQISIYFLCFRVNCVITINTS